MLVNFVAPPPQISTAHTQLRQKLTDYVKKQSGCRIKHSDQSDVPAIVTIVNESRVMADIDRDIRKAKGIKYENREVNKTKL